MYATEAGWQASLPKQPAAKSLSIGAASVPRDQPSPPPTTTTTTTTTATITTTTQAATPARLRLSLDLVARLSAALGAAPATCHKRPPEQQSSSSSPETATLCLADASQHHARCRRAYHCAGGSWRNSQPEAKSGQQLEPLSQRTPAATAEGAPTTRLEEASGGLQTRDSFHCTGRGAATATTTSLPDSLSSVTLGSSLLPSASVASSDSALRQQTATPIQDPTAGEAAFTALKFHCASSYITEPANSASLETTNRQPKDELTKTPLEDASLWGYLANSDLAAALGPRRLKCPLLRLPEATTSTSLPGAAYQASRSPAKQLGQPDNLTNSQIHILFSLEEQRQLDKSLSFRKTPVMRRPRRHRKLASSASLAAICDTLGNHFGPTLASNYTRSQVQTWIFTLLLMLFTVRSTVDATVLSPNDTSLVTGSLETNLAPLNLPPDDSNSHYGPLSRFLAFARIFVMVAIIIGDICGNSLVILSVCRHSNLRVTTNWFVVSLACADILVALFAMTFNASVVISGRWLFGRWLCDFWNSCDVLASTASILHLCCISIDRYIAITRPLDYPMKITTRRVMYALCAVWVSSALLSYLPIFTGVYTTSEHIEWLKANPDQCEFTVNRVYAIVSSSVSFWIPSSIMVFTYYRIYREASRQEKFIYKAQSMLPAPMPHSNHHHHSSSAGTGNNKPRSKRNRSKSVAVGAMANSRNQTSRQVGGGDLGPGTGSSSMATTSLLTTTTTSLQSAATGTGGSIPAISGGPAAGSLDQLQTSGVGLTPPASYQQQQQQQQQHQQPLQQLAEEQDSNSGHSTPTKRSISKMKREHKAAKTLGIIMGVFILCWLPFFSWYTPMHICGSACHHIVPPEVVQILFWIGYFNSTLNPIIYAYFNHDFRYAFKKTLQWIFCCCNDLKCLRVNRPNDNQHYNCTYRSTQEIGLVSNS